MGTLSLLSLHSRLGALLQHSEEDLKQGQQHLGLSDPCSCPVSSRLSFLEGFLHLISAPSLLALPLGFDSLLLACIARKHVESLCQHGVGVLLMLALAEAVLSGVEHCIHCASAVYLLCICYASVVHLLCMTAANP